MFEELPDAVHESDGTFSYNKYGIYNYHAAYNGDMRADFFDNVASDRAVPQSVAEPQIR